MITFGDFDLVNGQRCLGMVSMTSKGVINEQFQPDRDWRFTKQVHEREDGSIIMLSKRGLRDSESNLPQLALVNEFGLFEGTFGVILCDQQEEDEVFDIIGFGVQSNGTLVLRKT